MLYNSERLHTANKQPFLHFSGSVSLKVVTVTMACYCLTAQICATKFSHVKLDAKNVWIYYFPTSKSTDCGDSIGID